MDKPCKNCDKSRCNNTGVFEQECSESCSEFKEYASNLCDQLLCTDDESEV